MKSADDARRGAVEFAADESGGAGQFVGDRLDAGFQSIAVRIASAAVIAQRFHPRDADRELGQALAPRAAEAVGDDNRDGNPGAAFERASQVGGGAIRIFGKQQGVAASVDVGNIDAAVGAEEAVVGFGDQNAVLAADNGPALAHSEFDNAGIERVLFRPRDGISGGLDAGQVDEAAFRFGNDFVFHDKDVAGLESESGAAQGFQQFVRE